MKKYILANFVDYSKKEVGFYLVVLNTDHEYISQYADDAREYIAQDRKISADNIRILDCTFFGSDLNFLEGCESTQDCVRPRTAKDLAWDKERQKLKSEICRLKQQLRDKDSLIDAQVDIIKQHQAEISRLDGVIEQLKEVSHLSSNDVRALIDSKKKLNEAADLLKFMSGGFGSQFYI